MDQRSEWRWRVRALVGGRLFQSWRSKEYSGTTLYCSGRTIGNSGTAWLGLVGLYRQFIKVVVDTETDRLLGAAVLANDGAELVHVYIDVMNAGAPYQVIRDAIHIHPTLAEAVQSAVPALD